MIGKLKNCLKNSPLLFKPLNQGTRVPFLAKNKIWPFTTQFRIKQAKFFSEDKLNLYDMRKDYKSEQLTLSSLQDNPISQFRTWFSASLEKEAGVEPNMMTIATCDPTTLLPSSRNVLLKSVDDLGFTFFTNYNSRKGRELALNPKISAVFYWPVQNRSVRIEGTAERLTDAENDEYFHSRPLRSRISAVVSPQSEAIDEEKKGEMADEIERIEGDVGEGIERGSGWGGYRILPTAMEFWQGRESRFHDRFRYSWDAQKGVWEIEMLAP